MGTFSLFKMTTSCGPALDEFNVCNIMQKLRISMKMKSSRSRNMDVFFTYMPIKRHHLPISNAFATALGVI